jgi:hypothetical protein
LPSGLSISTASDRRHGDLAFATTFRIPVDALVCRQLEERSRYDEEIVMEFVLVIYQPWERLEEGRFSEEELAELNKYLDIVDTPGMKANYPLGYRKDATTVRVHDGQTITSDGTVGGIDATPGSFYVFEAEDKDAAIAFAERIPAARIGGAVEVRPVGQYW